MTLLEIITVLAVLLVAVIIFRMQKKCPSCHSCPSTEPPKSESKAPGPEQPQPTIPTAVNDQVTDMPDVSSSVQPTGVIGSSAKPEANETATSSPEDIFIPLPEDSTLRRHYLAHLITMIESVAPPRPTDSALCRHHDTMLAAKLEQCLSDKNALGRLIDEYEKIKAA